MATKGPRNPERSFGVSVGAVALAAAIYIGWNGSNLFAAALGLAGALLIGLGLLQPRLLYWPSAAWWRLAYVLGYINARIILTVLYGLLLVPLGLFWRVSGKDPLERRREHAGWSPYPARYRDPKHYLRMY
jgi:hypothetical protein